MRPRLLKPRPRLAVGSLAKAALDRLGALVSLVLLSPLLLVLGCAVRVSLGGPILFRQKRPGLLGQPFVLVKLRTMRPGDGDDAERLTSLGRFLRRWSFDELPELWNVVRGEMSLVGPRPLLMQYLDRYTPRQARRQCVKPGITGWAQVNGRNALTWDQRFELDVWYVENWSFGLDLKILMLTLGQVLRRKGIAHDGSATMPEFKGPADGAFAQR